MVFASCPKLKRTITGREQVCGSQEFELAPEQWLISEPNAPFQNVRLICLECGKSHIRAFDKKSFYEQFEFDRKHKQLKIKN
jgi:hypothetical protein